MGFDGGERSATYFDLISLGLIPRSSASFFLPQIHRLKGF